MTMLDFCLFVTDCKWALNGQFKPFRTVRAAEMNCDVIFKGTSVDGVYESDPKLDPNSKKYSTISYKKVLDDNLKVMDSSAITLARDNKIPMVVFSILKDNSFFKAVNAEKPHTIISEK